MISETDLITIKDATFLFDLDGVIFASEEYYTKFWTMEGKKYNIKDRDFANKIKGHGLNDIFNKYFFNKKDVQQSITEEIAIMEKNMQFDYIPGVKIFLEQLNKSNINKCLVTSSKRNKMEHVFEKRPEIKTFFPIMVTASDIKYSKPEPDCFIQGAKLSKKPTKDCIVFEDSLAGMQSAIKAGCKLIALATTLKEQQIKDYFLNQSLKTPTIIPDFNSLSVDHIKALL